MALPPVQSMVPLTVTLSGSRSSFGSLHLKKQKKSIKLTTLNAHTATTSATIEPCICCNSDNNMANHVNQLDFIVQFIRRVAIH